MRNKSELRKKIKSVKLLQTYYDRQGMSVGGTVEDTYKNFHAENIKKETRTVSLEEYKKIMNSLMLDP